MHFTYEKISGEHLNQGDILKRTPGLEAILKEVHPHYFHKPVNKYFIVLTQSCELVRRDGAPCAARYITLAAVRPLNVVVSRQVEKFARREIDPGLLVCTEKDRGRLTNFLERLFNNNELEYFYLEREPEQGLSEDCCAFLALSIAIKSDFHYGTCIDARLLSLNKNFRAKLGWLAGQMCSRVGTEDLSKDGLAERIARSLQGAAVWIGDREVRPLATAAAKWRAENSDTAMDEVTLGKLQQSLPKRREEAVERVIEILSEAGRLVPGGDLEKLKRRIKSDQTLKALVP